MNPFNLIALAKQEAARGCRSPGRLDRRLRRLHLHMINADDYMAPLNTDAAFITALRREGRERATAWLRHNFHHIGSPPFALTRHYA